MKESILFEKDNKIYKAVQGASIENITDGMFENVSISELFHRENSTYGIVLFSTNDKWPTKVFEIELLDEA